MDPKWFPSSNRPVYPTGLAQAGCTLIGVTSLLFPQGQFRNVIALPPLLLLAWKVRQHTSGSPEEDYLTAVNIVMAIAKYVDFAVMRIPEQSCHRIGTDKHVETTDEINRMSLWQKFKWSLELACTTRGIGVAYLFIDFYQWFIRSSPFGTTGPPPNLFSLPLREQFMYGWLRGFHSGFSMALGYYILAAVAVGTGLSSPQSWPPIYGSFIKRGYTVRNIWGRCWHQFLRRTFETSNSVLLALTKAKKGSFFSRYLQLYNGFLVSALIHHAGSLNMTYHEAIRYQFLFFMVQPVAITIEDFAIYCAKRKGLRDTWMTRAIGYIWTWTWLGFSLRYAAKFYFDLGLAAAPHPLVAKFSVMDVIWTA
ncbi:hypothetical protein B0A52_08540 [Exophiala mesophila]|uniref:Wax synthase domain-containing protein n=1 Tax=Exophiala mesophila TaxID=212818 RepID=A0A438MYA0_EXOME|nr:hypothetical protein B0A52_08540 [Exophiala mesophila]